MNHRNWSQYLLLALAALCALLTGLPAADAPVRLYENTTMFIQLFAVLAVVLSWAYLARSRRRWWNYALALGLYLLPVLILCKALSDAVACYTYYVPG